MALPAALTLVPLHGRILTAAGSPALGTVSFRIEQPLRDTTDDVILTPTTLSATLDTSGAFTISLPATDDPDVSPSGWTYAVSVSTDAWHETFRIAVPVATAGTLELADIAPAVPPATLVTYVLASTLGQTGGPAGPLDVNGLVPSAQIPGGGGGGGASPAGTVTDETTYGIAKTVGSSSLYARGDHTHGTPATPTAASVGADASGAATTAVSTHAGASDPHGDRAATTSAISTHAGAADPHGDRAYADTAVNAAKDRAAALRIAFKPTGRTETRSRLDSGVTSSTIVSGTLYLVPHDLVTGQPVNSISFTAGATALAGATHQWFALLDSNRALLALTTNDTSTAWAASAAKTLNIAQIAAGAASQFIATYTGAHYLCFCIVATTMPSITGGGSAGAPTQNTSPAIGGANSGMTTPPAFPFTANAPNVGGPLAYGWTA